VAEQVAGALLFLVPVVVAAIVAYVVTRPEPEPAKPLSDTLLPDTLLPETLLPDTLLPDTQPKPGARIVPFERRALDRRGGQPSALRRQPAPIAHPTLLHAALSSHLSAVSRSQTGAAQAASRAASLSAYQAADAARLVSTRRPARIPRRPSHRCPHRPE
jgi:hypothetical protein